VASFDNWLDAFQLAFHAPDDVPQMACPNCGTKSLHLRFVFLGDQTRTPYAAFWCNSCLEGLPTLPSEVADGCHPVRSMDADIPRYRFAVD
jgi:hypothetical protein